MDVIVREFAGKEREFRLSFGGVMDLEQALDDRIGSIFIRLSGGVFGVKDVYHTIRLALIGGNKNIRHSDVKSLMQDHFEARPLMEYASLAGEILCAVMIGIETDDAETDQADTPQRYKFSEVVQICRVFNMSPQELRDLRYADFVNLVRGFNASGEDQVEHLTEEEFMDILQRYEPEAIT